MRKSAGGNPDNFDGTLTLTCAVNEIRRLNQKAKGNAEHANYGHFLSDFIELPDYLSRFPQGSVRVFGPGTGDIFWPESVSVPAQQAVLTHFGENLSCLSAGGASSKAFSQMDRLRSKDGIDDYFAVRLAFQAPPFCTFLKP